MDNKDKQRNLIIILALLLIILGVANYYNYYAPPKPETKTYSFSDLSDKEKQDFINKNKSGFFNKKKNEAAQREKKTETKNESKIQSENSSSTHKVDISNENLSDNYIDYAVTSNGQLGIWRKDKIRVYVEPSEYQNTIYRALSRYNEIFEKYFKFYLTTKKDNADIVIEMTDHFPSNQNKEHGYLLGLTESSFLEGKELSRNKSWIRILSVKPDSNQKITQSEVYATTLHELGHAVGIVGHSPNPADIMYASSSTKNDLSARDKATLKLMYSGDKEAISKATSNFARTKLSEAEAYAKKYNSVHGWISLGKVYYDLDKKEEALEAYKKALSIEPKNPNIYETMANCYYNSGKYETAIKYYKISLDYIKGEAQKSPSYSMIGLAYSKLKDNENSYIYLKKALDADKTTEQNLKNYLIACYQLNKKSEALSAIQAYKTSVKPSIESDPEVKEILKWAK